MGWVLMSERELNRVEVLAHIKEEQEKAAPPPKVKPVSAKNGYKKTGRRPPGRPSKMEAYYERRRAERAAQVGQD